LHGSWIKAVAYQDADLAARVGQLLANGCQFLPIAATDGKAKTALSASPSKMMGGASARGTGGAPKHDVEFAIGHV
jgi:hypothetical protein